MLPATPDCTKPNPISKIEYHPLSLFALGQDLPIFTASPDSLPDPFPHEAQPGGPLPEFEQMSLFDGEVRQ